MIFSVDIRFIIGRIVVDKSVDNPVDKVVDKLLEISSACSSSRYPLFVLFPSFYSSEIYFSGSGNGFQI